MPNEQLKIEINHILESGANDIRLLELFERYLSLRDDKVAELKNEVKLLKDQLESASIQYEYELDLRAELTAANKRIEELEEEARQGRVSESQLIIAEKRISELENEVQRLKQSNPVNDWIKPEIDLPVENRKILFFPTTEAVKNYKSYHLRLGSFLKKDQWGRENMFCDGSFFPASAVDVWMYAPTPPQTK